MLSSRIEAVGGKKRANVVDAPYKLEGLVESYVVMVEYNA